MRHTLVASTIQPIGSGSTVTLNAAKIVVGTGITFESNGQAIYAGIITATSFSGSGANLTSLPAANITGTLPAISGANLTGITTTTINNNGSNRIITGSGTANTLEGEATFIYDGTSVATIDTSQTYATFRLDGSAGGAIEFYENGTRRWEMYGTDPEVAIYDRDKGAYHTRFKSGGNLELSDGKLLIGTTTEGATGADELTIATTGSTGLTIRSGTSNDGNIFFSDATSGTGEYSGYIQFEHANNALRFGTVNVERLRITSAGIIQCGTSGVLKAEINNAVSGHQFISQCSDNNNGFEIYQQHGSTASRNTLAVSDTRRGSKIESLLNTSCHSITSSIVWYVALIPKIIADNITRTSSVHWLNQGRLCAQVQP